MNDDTTKIMIDSKFSFGHVVATAALFNHCEENKFSLLPYLIRHGNCDWGDICDEDKGINEEALKDGSRLMSEYRLPDKRRMWIITEADRSVTTLLFPEDY